MIYQIFRKTIVRFKTISGQNKNLLKDLNLNEYVCKPNSVHFQNKTWQKKTENKKEIGVRWNVPLSSSAAFKHSFKDFKGSLASP